MKAERKIAHYYYWTKEVTLLTTCFLFFTGVCVLKNKPGHNNKKDKILKTFGNMKGEEAPFFRPLNLLAYDHNFTEAYLPNTPLEKRHYFNFYTPLKDDFFFGFKTSGLSPPIS